MLIPLALAMGLGSFVFRDQPATSAATPQSGAAAAANPFQGTYAGGYWGKISNSTPYGGEISATVGSTGVITLTLPGAGTGTATTTGGFTVTGKLTVSGRALNVAYTGNLVATKHPTTGAVLAVVGNGTWKVTTPGVVASGKWLVQRTKTKP